MLPAAAGSTFLKTNSEQSAFKKSLFGALKASNEDSLGHLFGTYGSQTFFIRPFSPSVAHPNFEKSSAKHVESAHGAVLQNDIIYHTCNFVTFWWLVLFAVCFWWLYTHFCLRLGPFEVIFAYVWVRFRLVFRPHGLCKCKCKCTCKCTCNRKCNCYLIRATGGLSIDR